MSPAAHHEAEESFSQALHVAREQHAKSLELRAALSLSRLWCRLNKRATHMACWRGSTATSPKISTRPTFETRKHFSASSRAPELQCRHCENRKAYPLLRRAKLLSEIAPGTFVVEGVVGRLRRLCVCVSVALCCIANVFW